jgi:phenylacetate-CoA ligase
MSHTLRIPVVFTSSETLQPLQRKEIEEAFQCRIFDWYGSSERVAAIGECEHGTYHEFPHYGIVEYLPAQEGMVEVVGTSLHNTVMPLFRYNVGDLVTLGDEQPCPCGRPFRRIARIIGRTEDCVIMRDGRKVVPMEERCFHGIANIFEAQVVQDAPGLVVVRVVPQNPAKGIDHRGIIRQMVKHIGGAPEDFTVELVGAIEREKNGKYRFVKSSLREGVYS